MCIYLLVTFAIGFILQNNNLYVILYGININTNLTFYFYVDKEKVKMNTMESKSYK